MSSPPAPACTTFAKAAWTSRSLAAFTIRIWCPMARAASSRSRDSLSTSGPFGSRKTAIIDALGTNSCRIPSSLATNGTTVKTTPVILPPGRLRLATKPTLTGSAPMTNIMGVVAVTALLACAASVPAPTIAATCRRTRSAAGLGSRSCGLSDWQVARLGATQNLIDVVAGAPEQVRHVGSIGHQTARFDEFPRAVHRWQARGQRQGIDANAVGTYEWVDTDIKCISAAFERLESGRDVFASPDF